MKCTHCGREIENDSVFCEFCGKKQTMPVIQDSDESLKAQYSLAFGVCSIIGCILFGIGIIFGIIGILLSKNNTSSDKHKANMFKVGKITSMIGIIVSTVGLLWMLKIIL